MKVLNERLEQFLELEKRADQLSFTCKCGHLAKGSIYVMCKPCREFLRFKNEAAELAPGMARALLYVINHHKGLESERAIGHCYGLLKEIHTILTNEPGQEG